MEISVEQFAIVSLGGLAFAIIGGHLATRMALWHLWGRKNDPPMPFTVIPGFKHIPPPKPLKDMEGGVPSWWVGFLERFFFTIVVGSSGAGVGSAIMMAWLGVKAATNWKHQIEKANKEKQKMLTASQVSLFATMLSFLFALIGGLIINLAVTGKLPVLGV